MKHALKLLLFSLLIFALTGCGSKSSQPTTANVNPNVDKGSGTTTTSPALEEASGEKVEDTNLTKIPTNDNKKDTLLPAFILEDNIRKYGYIDENGTFVISPVYDSATDYSEGLAVVTTMDSYKVIDTAGKVICKNDMHIGPFHNGAAKMNKITTKLLYGYIDTTGKEIAQGNLYEFADNFNSDNQAFVYTGGKSSIIDKSGKVLESYNINAKYHNVIDIEDGYIIYSDLNTGYYGVINYKGEEILDPKSDPAIVKYLGNDIFEIKQKEEDSYLPSIYSASALMNINGEQLTEFNLYDLSKFNGGYASATDDKYTYFIDNSGKIIDNLPKLEGRGTLSLLGDIIKAEIDRDLFYMKKDGTILWHSQNEQKLISDINIKEVKYKPIKYVTVYYPVVEGLKNDIDTKINNKLYELFIEPRKNITENDQLSVEDSFTSNLQKQLLVINQNGYDYPFGAAHGMPIKNYYHFNIDTGEFYTLKDLFIKNCDYVTKINSIIIEMMEEQEINNDSMLFPDSFDTIAKDHNFYLTKDGLVIYFYPYEIAAYAAGFPEFIIPFEKLSDIIDEQGAFWKSFH